MGSPGLSGFRRYTLRGGLLSHRCGQGGVSRDGPDGGLCKGEVIILGEVGASLCCLGRVVTGETSEARVGLYDRHCAPFGSATVAATLIGA